MILVDAYQDITIPFQMSSTEFFTLVKEHLNENGIMVVNMNVRGSEDGNINQYLADTISTVFSDVYTADVIRSSNRELFASNNPEMLNVFMDNLESETDATLTEMMSQVNDGLVRYKAGNYIMTDDKAPVELLGMRVIDDMIKDEVEYYREVYKEGGIDALLEQL